MYLLDPEDQCDLSEIETTEQFWARPYEFDAGFFRVLSVRQLSEIGDNERYPEEVVNIAGKLINYRYSVHHQQYRYFR